MIIISDGQCFLILNIVYEDPLPCDNKEMAENIIFHRWQQNFFSQLESTKNYRYLMQIVMKYARLRYFFFLLFFSLLTNRIKNSVYVYVCVCVCVCVCACLCLWKRLIERIFLILNCDMSVCWFHLHVCVCVWGEREREKTRECEFVSEDNGYWVVNDG